MMLQVYSCLDESRSWLYSHSPVKQGDTSPLQPESDTMVAVPTETSHGRQGTVLRHFRRLPYWVTRLATTFCSKSQASLLFHATQVSVIVSLVCSYAMRLQCAAAHKCVNAILPCSAQAVSHSCSCTTLSLLQSMLSDLTH